MPGLREEESEQAQWSLRHDQGLGDGTGAEVRGNDPASGNLAAIIAASRFI
jgi:hypothetical protein